MNHIYSVLWNGALGRFCVTSEIGRSRSRATSQCHAAPGTGLSARLPTLALSMALAWAMPAWSQAVLPQGANVVSGTAQITTSGNQMLVQQGSAQAIVDWQSFHIGKGQQVQFLQPNAASVALNRVVGADASAIHGSLTANGKVFLVNPNGVLFGADAHVNVGSLVASTLNISNANFLNGTYQFNGLGSGLQGASIINQGTITAAKHGAVALLGGTVSNQGAIAARLGSVALAAGNQVSLDFAGDGLLNVQVQQSAVNALAENHQLLRADGGSVLIAAQATDALLQTVVNNTGTVQARTVENRAGKIVLLGGFNGGITRVGGTLDASAPEGGNGGFADTSGANVQIATGARVTTEATLGQTGTWLIDPTDFTISAGNAPQTQSGMGAQTLIDNLAGTNAIVEVLTDAQGNGKGDIHVNAPVSWSKNKLTLNAHGSININDVMSVSGTGTLALNYGGTAGDMNTAPASDTQLNVRGNGRVDFTQTGTGWLAVNGHDYMVINDLDALQNMQNQPGGKFALGGSVDASATAGWNGRAGFAPLGRFDRPFTGIFDGLGHTIDGLTIDRPEPVYVGLFGYAEDATLRNVGLVGGSIKGSIVVGGLVGYNKASISNAYVTGAVSGVTFIGGLVGENYGSISNAYATGAVSGDNFIGGLVGYNGGSISNAYALGAVSGNLDLGGLVGLNFGSISNVYATGAVSGDDYAGGLVGENWGSISNAYATGAVAGVDGSTTGGLVGFNFNDGTVADSYWNTETTGQAESAGGGRGLTTLQMLDVSQMPGFAFGTAWGNANNQTTPYLLGLAGNQVFNKNDLPAQPTADNRPKLYTALLDVHQLQAVQSQLDGRFVLGNPVDATATVAWNGGAGFAPLGSSATPFTGIFDGLGHTIDDLTIQRESQEHVGLFGYASNATLRNVGLVGGSVSGKDYVGGLVGYSLASYGTASIFNAYATANVTGNYETGGLVGRYEARSEGTASMSNAYATGNVTGNGEPIR